MVCNSPMPLYPHHASSNRTLGTSNVSNHLPILLKLTTRSLMEWTALGGWVSGAGPQNWQREAVMVSKDVLYDYHQLT